MDHCQNANKPDRTSDGLIEVPEPREPTSESVAISGSDDVASAEETIQELDHWADELRQEHLQNALTSLSEHEDLDEDQRAAIADCSRALVDEILRCPRWRLRSDSTNIAEATAELFDLDVD